MGRFERAVLIAAMDGRDPRPAEIIGIAADLPDNVTIRELERLESEGVVERTEYPTYCSECGSDSGVEYRYALRVEVNDD